LIETGRATPVYAGYLRPTVVRRMNITEHGGQLVGLHLAQLDQTRTNLPQ